MKIHEERDLTNRILDAIERITQRISRIENNRVHGIVLVILGAASTALITVLMVAFEWLGLNPSPRGGSNPACVPSIMLMFVGLLSIPIIGIGVVEIITGKRWNEAKGVFPFLILAIVCIPLFILFFTGSLSLMG